MNEFEDDGYIFSTPTDISVGAVQTGLCQSDHTASGTIKRTCNPTGAWVLGPGKCEENPPKVPTDKLPWWVWLLISIGVLFVVLVMIVAFITASKK
jgi:hypothetical protein